jgi:hypothetical protein
VRKAAPVVRREAEGLLVAYPFLGEGERPAGVVALELLAEAETKAALRSLHWGVGWLEAQALRGQVGLVKSQAAGAAAALDIVAVASEYDRPEAAAMAVANEMALRRGSPSGFRRPRASGCWR